MSATETVTVRDLRNHGGRVLDEVLRGHAVVVTRDGEAVAELRPSPRRGASAAELIARRRHQPDVDLGSFRADVDSVVDMSL
jgi:prevent-host-death family protein